MGLWGQRSFEVGLWVSNGEDLQSMVTSDNNNNSTRDAAVISEGGNQAMMPSAGAGNGAGTYIENDLQT